MRMALSGSRTEFLASDTLGTAGDIQYSRTGGCFVSTKKGVLAFLLYLASLIVVGLLVYYLAVCPQAGRMASSNATSESQGQEGAAGAPTGGGSGGGAGGGSSEQPAPPPGPTAAQLRLPQAVRPHYYSIWLQPFIGDPASNNFTYKGLVDVELSCSGAGAGDACSRIALHAKDLNVSWDEVSLRLLPQGVSSADERGRMGRAIGKKYNASAESVLNANATAPNATATPANGTAPNAIAKAQPVRITGHQKATDVDMIIFTLESPMQVGRNYSLEIPFWGNISTQLSGFYRSSYTEANGTKRWLAVTHFEPTSARKAFPCFDEPALKARFEMHVARRPPAASLSNMPLARTDAIPDQPGWVWDHYPASPVMSSYLVALVVSELGERASSPAPGQPAFSVAARPELLSQAQYALDVGPRMLSHYADYFNASYPLPKLTMGAVPDFAAGAMENWGLVLYRETLMLYDPATSTVTSQQSVAEVVAHELAHQWFGNLVTMKWWSDLWLNEGFATYVAYIGVNHVEPTWNMLDKMVTDEMHPVLETDCLNSSHPVSVEVHNPSEISQVFDAVSYNKGACLIRMLNHSLTEPVFRSGLARYVNKWKWSNAEQDDLWAALTEAAEVEGRGRLAAPIKAVMDSWTLQQGFPVLLATRDYTAGALHLAQRPFKLDGTDGSREGKLPAWYVPVSYATGEEPSRLEDTRARVWLTPDQRDGLTVANVTRPGSNTWLLINLQQTGYYRVNYDSANWRLLTDLLHSDGVGSVPAASRAQLLSDAMELARAGLLGYDAALNLTQYLQRERHRAPWAAFLRAYAALDYLMRDASDYAHLQAWAVRLATPLVQSLGLEARPSDSQPERQLRASAMGHLLRAQEPRMLDWASAQFAQMVNASADAPNPVPVDMRFEVYCSAAARGGAREWTQLDARYRRADRQPGERSNLLRALMCTRQPHLVRTMLERSLEMGGDIRLQDAIYVWRSVRRNPVACYMAFPYVRDNWDSIYHKYSKISFVLKEVLRSSIGGLSTEKDLEDATAFVRSHESQLAGVSRAVEEALEKLRLRVRWRSRHRPQVAAWLRANALAPDGATTATTTATTAAAATTPAPATTNTTTNAPAATPA